MGLTKFCRYHKVEHPIEQFHVDKSSPDGRMRNCKVYFQDRWKAKHPVAIPLKGRRVAPARDGDRRQAQRRIQTLVENGTLPHPNTLPCKDCGKRWNGDKKSRIEYDHAKGYAPEFHETVEPRCVKCHKVAEALRIKERTQPSQEYDPGF